MPVDLKRYPADWKAIADRIRARAVHGGSLPMCECLGECGVDHTAEAYAWGEGDPLHGRCVEANGEPGVNMRGRVVLTVAHLGVPKPDGSPGDPHDKMDCRDENLKAMCQACHLRYDHAEHVANRKRNAAARREAIEPTFPQDCPKCGGWGYIPHENQPYNPDAGTPCPCKKLL